MLAAIARTAARLCDANDALIFALEADHLRLVAKHGRVPVSHLTAAIPLSRALPGGSAVLHRRAIHVRDMARSRWARHPDLKARLAVSGARTALHVPLLRGRRALGAIIIRRTQVRPFTRHQIALLKTFADQAAIAIENVRLGQELEARNAELMESLERERATGEILGVISRSPTELEPVFDAIAESARRLCDTYDVAIAVIEGEMCRTVAHRGSLGTIPPGQAFPLTSGLLLGRAAIERRTIHVPDITELDEAEYPVAREWARQWGLGTGLFLPLLRDGAAIGVIALRRREVRPFTERQIELVQTLADQAVIAIENVRLFTELQEKNREITDALAQQTATSEILRVIAGTPTDVSPVFDAICESVVRLFDAQSGGIVRVDDGVLHLAAVGAPDLDACGLLRPAFPRPADRELIAGRAILDAAVVQISDTEDDVSERQRAVGRQLGFRRALAMPMLRDGRAIGAITVTGRDPGLYSERHIELLRTFADQAVIAIENARLFTELRVRNRDLLETLEQQTATSEILSVISSSPTEIQPVFDTIVQNASRLCGGLPVGVYQYDGELIHQMALAAQNVLDADTVEELRRAYPMRPGDASATSRAVLTGQVVRIRDIHEDSEHHGRGGGLHFRRAVSVPMLRDGRTIGTITVAGLEPGDFPESQIDLLKTFADQAVIAVENVRLFKELETRNHDLTVALDQQTATSEILKAISSAQTDARPVFDAIARSAVRLCGAFACRVFRSDGEVLQVVGEAYGSPEAHARFLGTRPEPIGTDSPSATAMRERRIVQHPDVPANPDLAERYRERALARGYRALMSVPMLRGDVALGVIAIARQEPVGFSEQQVALIKTFAEQAAIAIENVRLFKELQASNRELTEALDRQTATAEILSVISRSGTDLQPVFDAMAESARRLLRGWDALVIRLSGDGLEAVAISGGMPDSEAMLRPALGTGLSQTLVGESIVARELCQIADSEADNVPPAIRERARARGWRAILAVPLLLRGEAIGGITVSRREPGAFSVQEIDLLQTFADQAVIAIENARLLTELQASNRELTTALEQQTATGEILRVISSSPTDERPVFDAIARSSVRLCAAAFSVVAILDADEMLHLVASEHVGTEGRRSLAAAYPMRPNRGQLAGRAILDRAVVQVADVTLDPEYVGAALGNRATLSVPMVRKGTPIGTITIGRFEPLPFTDQQIELLKTFADQAVIAIENVRLFRELQERTAELTRSVEQLTALGEVGQAVSSTLDLETVLTTIVSRATQLSGADAGAIFEYDEHAEQFELRATQNLPEEFLERARPIALRRGEGAIGRLAETREPVAVPDIAEPDAYRSRLRDVLLGLGHRALLAVPLLREERVIGGLIINRKTPGAFPRETVDLLKTFATQSALAIQNARLFREIEDKSRQLEVASRHKSDFLANVSHELRTPLNAILGFNEMILGQVYGDVPPDLKEPLTDIQNSGKHLLRLINNVLDLSKIEAGRMELALADYSVQDTVESVRGALRPLAADKGLEFIAAVPEDIPLAHGDPGRITQCLMNLAGNALKFSREGRVEISVELKGDLLVYRVTDTGIGIAKDKIETVFAEFRQGDATITSEFGGTGLGLSITKKFVEMHRGRIWVESELGRGSTFSFAIPLRLDGERTA